MAGLAALPKLQAFPCFSCYAFDMRRLKIPLNIYKDHVSAVIDVDFNPTGKEFVSGSYDKTIRIFETDKVKRCFSKDYSVRVMDVTVHFMILQGHSREVYHTKRMQRLTSVLWTKDSKYIISGSDEMNIRIWKAKAWEKLGVVRRIRFLTPYIWIPSKYRLEELNDVLYYLQLKTKERQALNYNDSLKEKFSSFPQVKRILRHRHVPKHVYHAKQEHRTIQNSKLRKYVLNLALKIMRSSMPS